MAQSASFISLFLYFALFACHRETVNAMPASNTRVSNLSQLPQTETADKGSSIAVGKGYTIATRPVLLITCSSDDGCDASAPNFVPKLVIEPESVRSRQMYSQRDYL
jgi:hypothetical protein